MTARQRFALAVMLLIVVCLPGDDATDNWRESGPSIYALVP